MKKYNLNEKSIKTKRLFKMQLAGQIPHHFHFNVNLKASNMLMSQVMKKSKNQMAEDLVISKIMSNRQNSCSQVKMSTRLLSQSIKLKVMTKAHNNYLRKDKNQ